MQPMRISFAGGGTALTVRVDEPEALGPALAALGLRPPSPVVVVVGGAGGLSRAERDALRPLFTEGLAPAVEALGAVAVDGGTASGVMALLGEARSSTGGSFPLVGVAAGGTVAVPDGPAPRAGAADLEPHHTGFVLVPGEDWGAEAQWIVRTATTLAGGSPSVTVLVNGGDVAYDDVRRSVEASRPVLAVAGTGRTSDELVAALRGQPADARAIALVSSGLVREAPGDDPIALRRLLINVLRDKLGAGQ